MSKNEVVNQTVTLSVVQTQKFLSHMIQTAIDTDEVPGYVPILTGPPGSGKSFSIKAATKKHECKPYEMRLSMLEPIDVRGLPDIRGDAVTWIRPEDMPPTDYEGWCLLNIDEFQQGLISVQNTMGQLIYDRRIGEYRLPKRCILVLSTNRTEDRAGTVAMPTQVANRLMHIDVHVDVEEAVRFAVSENWDKAIVATLMYRPDLVYSFNPQKDTRAFPTMRSWEYVDKFLKSNPELMGDESIVRAGVEGCIGSGAGAVFFALRDKLAALPNLDQFLKDPSKFKLPTNRDDLFAYAIGFSRKASKENIDNFMVLASKFPVELNVMMVRDTENSYPAHNSRLWGEWVREYGQVFDVR